MKKSRLLGAACAVVFTLVATKIVHASSYNIDFVGYNTYGAVENDASYYGGDAMLPGLNAWNGIGFTSTYFGGVLVSADFSEFATIEIDTFASAGPYTPYTAFAPSDRNDLTMSTQLFQGYGSYTNINIYGLSDGFYDIYIYSDTGTGLNTGDVEAYSLGANYSSAVFEGSAILFEDFEISGNYLYLSSYCYAPLCGISGIQLVSAVPVPAAVWLFGSGLLGLVGIARRKKA